MPVGDKRGRGYELGTTVVQIQIVARGPFLEAPGNYRAR